MNLKHLEEVEISSAITKRPQTFFKVLSFTHENENTTLKQKSLECPCLTNKIIWKIWFCCQCKTVENPLIRFYSQFYFHSSKFPHKVYIRNCLKGKFVIQVDYMKRGFTEYALNMNYHLILIQSLISWVYLCMCICVLYYTCTVIVAVVI